MKYAPVILHVGPHKTATTSLQTIFALNSARLENEGVFLPPRELWDTNASAGVNNLALEILGFLNHPFMGWEVRKSCVVFSKWLEASDSDAVQIVSAEDAIYWGLREYEKFKQLVAPRPVQVVFGHRSYPEWSISLWKHRLFWGIETRSLAKFQSGLARFLKFRDYFSTLRSTPRFGSLTHAAPIVSKFRKFDVSFCAFIVPEPEESGSQFVLIESFSTAIANRAGIRHLRLDWEVPKVPLRPSPSDSQAIRLLSLNRRAIRGPIEGVSVRRALVDDQSRGPVENPGARLLAISAKEKTQMVLRSVYQKDSRRLFDDL